MLKFTSKEQLKNASEDEVIEFFNKVKFQGKFYPSVPDKFQESFCGRIENMSIGREHNDLCVSQFYVPNRFKDYVRPGICEFICGVNLEQLHGTPSKYKLFIKKIYNKQTYNTANKRPTAYTQKQESNEEKILKRNLKLEDNLFIGQFTQNKDGSFTIRDIRRSDFSKLILQNGKEQQPIVYHPKTRKPSDNRYYEFSWILNGAREDYVYLFKVDESKPLKGINAHEVINRLNKSIMEYKADAGQKIVKMLETLKTQLTASGRDIFIYELLQNANDYPVKSNEEVQKVDVEFHITQHSLIFMHTGAEFNEKNIAAICSINDKEKTDNKDAIGYKGIGFKTVFLDNNYVYLKTGGFSFRFDKEETKDIVDTPWQILPIWTPYSALSAEENQVFRNASNDFRVKFALRPTDTNILRDTDQNYTDMFKEVFANERVILFIPNLKSVKVFFGDTETPEIDCQCDNDHWQVNNFEEPVDAETTKLLNEALDQQETSGSLKIPTKYYNFSKTKVSFACEKDGTELKGCEDTQIYCYLPTRATWGFKFLMNTDMIPTGPRDDIEIDFANQININAEIAEIAGDKFFDWIKGLCKSNHYTKTSIFNLVPSFGDIKDKHGKYKPLIERFQTGFEERIKTDELIPVGDDKYALISDVVFDETGLSSSGIMSDEEFLRFTGKQGYSLPLPELRKDTHFNFFLERYALADEQKFKKENLRDLIANDDFQGWLKDQENNNKFLQFLLDNNYLEDLLDANIFLEDEGSLNAAKELYYDVDKYLKDLEAFTDHIAFLSRETREYFKGNTKWERVIDNKFAEFDCDEFVDDTLLNFYQQETIERLKDKDTSVHFYKFLAENVEYRDRYLDLPFFDTNNNVVEGFSGRLRFFTSEIGEKIGKSQWLSEININFISSDYAATTKEYFQEHFGVREYSDEVIVKEIILSSSNQSKISNAIDNDFDISRDFVRFCFNNQDIISNGELSKYTLKSYDCNGDELWSNENVFFGSSCFEYYSQKKWLGSDWMTEIDRAYFADYASEEDFKEFLLKTFGVKELTDTTFYTDVVRPNLKTIFENTSGSADSDGAKNFDFVKYLDDNSKLIFTEKKDSDRFKKGFKITNIKHQDSWIGTANLYLYDEELKGIVEADWFPSVLVTLCSTEYGDSEALCNLEIKQYRFSSFFDEVIAPNIGFIDDLGKSKKDSISFHNFVISHQDDLSKSQLVKMKNAMVYLYGNKIAHKSNGHNILSKKAKELLDSGLVKFSDLDIIDPDYTPEKHTEYWKGILENIEFTPDKFYEWIEANLENFCQTLQDRSLNLKFWRWAKKNTSNKLQEIANKLPILLKNGDQPVCMDSNTVYISNEYLGNGGIESLVRKYDENALFISPEYIEEDSDNDSWKEFWVKAGIKHDIIDIIVESAIPNLAEIENEELLHILAENRDALDKRYSETGGLIKQLEQLRIKAHDGNFYTVHEAIYVDCEKDEPFTYIELSNQITFASTDDRRLAKEMIEEFNGKRIDSLSEWQQCKLNQYLELQDNNPDAVREFHYQFINDLALIKDNDSNTLKELKRITEIKLLNREGQFCDASTLTMGSVYMYHSFFDFEACGLELEYISDTYKTKCSNINSFFVEMNVHRYFRKEDIPYLENRKCAIYFWGTYLCRKSQSSIEIDIKNYFNDIKEIACIPTRDDMKRPDELYYGIPDEYINCIFNGENKIPLKELPDIKLSDGATVFDKLPFKQSLNFMDSLEALANGINKKDDRKKLLEWMIEDYNASNKESCDQAIREYRYSDKAEWRNTKKEYKPIKELYALNSDKELEQIIGSNPRIIDKSYLPTGDKDRKTACDILGIKTITLEDLTFEGIDKTEYRGHDELHKFYVLALAGNIDAENWETLYDKYCEKLDSLSIYKCKEIHFAYKEDNSINQSRLFKFYYDEKANAFYFVKELGSRATYSKYVSAFIKYLGIREREDIFFDLAAHILEDKETTIEELREKNALMVDERFKEELYKFAPELRGKLSGNSVDDVNEQPTGTTSSRTALNPRDGSEYETNGNNPLGESPSHGNTQKEGPQSEGNNNSNTHEGEPSKDNPRAEGHTTSGSDTHSNGIGQTSSPIGEGNPTYARTQNGANATEEEIRELKDLLGSDLSYDAILTQNYLVRLRFYKFLEKNGYAPKDSESDFIKKNAKLASEALSNGKDIHVCSAAGGIMYLSPLIWNKIEDDNCMVCAYFGSHGEDFKFFNSLDEIKKQIDQDAVLIKLSGSDKFDVVKDLYSRTLKDVTGTAYTMIRVKSNERYKSIFDELFKSRGYNDDDV